MAVQLLLEHHMKFLDKSSKGGNRTFVCINCGNKYNGSQTRQLAHLLGPKGKGIAVCNKIHEDARQELLATVNRVNGNAAGQTTTCVAIVENEHDGGQSRKRFRQQELPCILKASSLPPSNDAQGGDVPNSPASPAGHLLCRQQASQTCTVHVATQDATAQEPMPEGAQDQPTCNSMEETDKRQQEAWALPASTMEPTAGRQSPQQCTPAEQNPLDGQTHPRMSGSLPCSATLSGQQAGGCAGHNSRDPRRQSLAERRPLAAAAAAGTPPALGIHWPTRSPRNITSLTAAGGNAFGREALPCRVFDCSTAAAEAVSAGGAALTGPISPLALSWRLSPDQHCPDSNQPEQQCEGELAQHLSSAAVRDSDLIALQAQVSRLEAANQELAQKFSDQKATREEERLRVAELRAELKVKDEHIKALLQVIKEGLIGQQH